jgi:cytochrome b involved in lipid metabolism
MICQVCSLCCVCKCWHGGHPYGFSESLTDPLLLDVPKGEQEGLVSLKRAAGGSAQGLPTDPGQLSKLLWVLQPYRRAVVMDQKYRHHQTALRVLTKAMLSNYDNPNSGCYTSVNGFVYDLTSKRLSLDPSKLVCSLPIGYMEMHPGGSNILIKYLGSEATEFYDWHDTELLDEHSNLLVGRIVPEITIHDVSKHQIAIHGWVFDISSLAPGRSGKPEESWIYTQVNHLGGTDASNAILEDESKAADALAQLFLEFKECIVGWLHKDHELPFIPSEEVKKHKDPKDTCGAWTVVNELVYDITRKSYHITRC